MFNRSLSIKKIIQQDQDFKGFLILGPRQTGKSTILAIEFPKDDAEILSFNLLQSDLWFELNTYPERLRERVLAVKPKLVIIDEIQKIPALLNEVQLLIDEHKLTFILTGSSARRLKSDGVNLLGGRLRQIDFHPLIYQEIGAEQFSLRRALSFGTLPPVFLAKNPHRVLKSYCSTYLKEEIAAEGIVRNLPAFSRFLQVAALNDGEMLLYTSTSNDAGVPKTTVIEYFQILFDTLIARELPAFRQTVKRKPIETSKVYFFDVGVARFLAGKKQLIEEDMINVGKLFETYIHHELRAYLSYQDIDLPLSHWRSTSNYEVDFIIGEDVAIEVKTTSRVSSQDLKGLRAFAEEGIAKKKILICREPARRLTEDGILVLPYQEFLNDLWSGAIIL